MKYLTMTVSGRHRILAAAGEGDARFVTTVADGEAAKAIAQALSVVVDDLPHALSYSLPVAAGIDPDRVDVHDQPGGWDPYEWARLDLAATPVDVVRRTLSYLDDPDRGYVESDLLLVSPLARLLVDQPESVRRAVRDELANALAPYDGIPVIGVVYDRKYGECRTPALFNAALPHLTEAQLDDLEADRNSAWVHVMSYLGGHELADFGYADSTGDAGYLDVVVNRSLLRQWRAART